MRMVKTHVRTHTYTYTKVSQVLRNMPRAPLSYSQTCTQASDWLKPRTQAQHKSVTAIACKQNISHRMQTEHQPSHANTHHSHTHKHTPTQSKRLGTPQPNHASPAQLAAIHAASPHCSGTSIAVTVTSSEHATTRKALTPAFRLISAHDEQHGFIAAFQRK